MKSGSISRQRLQKPDISGPHVRPDAQVEREAPEYGEKPGPATRHEKQDAHHQLLIGDDLAEGAQDSTRQLHEELA